MPSQQDQIELLEQQFIVTLVRLIDGRIREKPNEDRYLRMGLTARFWMLKSARDLIRQTLNNQGEAPLGTETRAMLDIALNSFYINLAGSLDNAAWGLAHRYGLMENLDESSNQARRFCNLFGTNFLDNLKGKNIQVAEAIGAQLQWNNELKELRDPTAHRIPLTFVSGVLSPEEGKQYFELYRKRNEEMEKAAELSSQGKYEEANGHLDKALEHVGEAEQLGFFVPMISTSVEGNTLRSAMNQIDSDYNSFIRLMEIIIGSAWLDDHSE